MNLGGTVFRLGVGLMALTVLGAGCQRGPRPCCSASRAASSAETHVTTEPAPPAPGADATEPESAPSPVAAPPAEERAAARAPADRVAEVSRTPPEEPDTQIIAYYFHRTMRCPTCLSIERQTRKTLEAVYADQLASGRLAWRPTNIDEPESAHFEHDFDLTASALVLVTEQDGRVVRWTKLEAVWDLVEDPVAFEEHVWTQLAHFAGF